MDGALPTIWDVYPQYDEFVDIIPDRLQSAYENRLEAFPKKRLVDIFKNIVRINGEFNEYELPTVSSYGEPRRRKK